MNHSLSTIQTSSPAIHDEVLEHFRLIFQILSDAIFKNYRTTIRQFLNWLQQEQILQPKMEDVLLWKESLKKKGFKTAAINNQLTALRKFFQYPDITQFVKNEKEDQELIRE